MQGACTEGDYRAKVVGRIATAVDVGVPADKETEFLIHYDLSNTLAIKFWHDLPQALTVLWSVPYQVVASTDNSG